MVAPLGGVSGGEESGGEKWVPAQRKADHQQGVKTRGNGIVEWELGEAVERRGLEADRR